MGGFSKDDDGKSKSKKEGLSQFFVLSIFLQSCLTRLIFVHIKKTHASIGKVRRNFLETQKMTGHFLHLQNVIYGAGGVDNESASSR